MGIQLIRNPKMKLIWGFTIIIAWINAIQLTATPAFTGNVLGNGIPDNFAVYWNQVTSENAARWGSVEASRDSMNWSIVDSHVNYAKARGIPYKLYCLVWGSAQPSWMTSISNAEFLEEIIEWFMAVDTRYRPDLIDVVNEPIHAKPPFRNALGGDGETGWDWVIKSFRLARQYCSHSQLLINEYGVLSDSAAMDQYLTIIDLLKSQGLLDGIGIQCHQFYIDTLAADTIKSGLDKLAETGLPIYVSELDISGDDAVQLERYREKFPVFYTHPGVRGITFWGYILGQTWRTNTHLVNSGDIGTIERPAMVWLKSYLNKPTPSPTGTTARTGTITPAHPGDVNDDGSITIIDALMIAQYYVGLDPVNFMANRADVNCDGNITIVDALIVAQYYVGLVTEFC